MVKFSCMALAAAIALHGAPALAQNAAAPAAVADQQLSASIDRTLAPYFKADEAGATVIVTRAGLTVFRKAYGLADVTRGQAMQADMTLRLGSITKQFTAVAILMLAEQGKLAVTDDITRFLPDYPTRGKKITIAHLLSHTSGVVSYTSLPGFGADVTRDFTVSQMIDRFKNQALEFEPGERFNYSNSGYFLLGAIIEKISGQSYADFLANQIFIPLGMADTAYQGHERRPATIAPGHRRAAAGFEAAAPLSMSQPYAAGALVSSVDDLARWDAAITAGKLLKPASWRQAFTPFVLNNGKPSVYGYGWFIGKLQDEQQMSHGGDINGYASYAARLPASQIYVAVLTNAEGGKVRPSVIGSRVAALALGKPLPELVPFRLEPAALDQFVGVYRGDDTTRTVSRQQDRLFVQRSGGKPVALIPYAPTGFYIENTLVRFDFEKDGQGAPTRLVLTQESGSSVYPRLAQPAE